MSTPTEFEDIWALQQAMADRGYWMELKSPFSPVDHQWICGFTPRMTTGWNGRPDFQGFGDTPLEAAIEAYRSWEEEHLGEQS